MPEEIIHAKLYLLYAVLSPPGPIVSSLSNKFGCRAVAISGSILATVAFVLSTLSPNVDVMIITYGAMGSE